MNNFINDLGEINVNFINSNKKIDNLKKIIFIHTPKCGGTYVSSILKYLKIENKHHNQATNNEDFIFFTVVRNPIERFESLLNYRLDKNYFNSPCPSYLKYAFDNENITLNEILNKMSDEEMLNFTPYRTLKYWITNIDIVITIEQLPEMLKYFGYTYDINLFKPLNISKKQRGILNEENKNKIKKAFYDDVLLYEKITKIIL